MCIWLQGALGLQWFSFVKSHHKHTNCWPAADIYSGVFRSKIGKRGKIEKNSESVSFVEQRQFLPWESEMELLQNRELWGRIRCIIRWVHCTLSHQACERVLYIPNHFMTFIKLYIHVDQPNAFFYRTEKNAFATVPFASIWLSSNSLVLQQFRLFSIQCHI